MWITKIKRFFLIVGILSLLYLICTNAVMPIYTRHGQEISVPDVTGLSFAEAFTILSDQKFKVIKDRDTFDSQYPPGYVVSQNPLPRARVKKKRRIYVTVSKGERLVLMPKLVGQSERNTELEISQLGLVLRNITYEYSPLHLKDVVIEQSLQENERIRQGTEVEIVVSLGLLPDNFLVPNVVGKLLPDAQKAIEKAGLSVGRTSYQTTDKLLPNTVIEQSLKPDTEVVQGTAINLIVSKLPESGDKEGGWR